MRYGYSVTAALECFEENLRLFGDVRTQPEKYNLYNVLANLAHGIIQMQEEIRKLQGDIDEVQRHLRARK